MIDILRLHFESNTGLNEISNFLDDLNESLEIRAIEEAKILKNQEEICQNITIVIDNMLELLNDELNQTNNPFEKGLIKKELLMKERNTKLVEKQLEIIKCNNWKEKYLLFTKERYSI